jgi:crotonobetainyl-CoA:carnitine CoA-transferase CaiB-like acyl-CoA transferase
MGGLMSVTGQKDGEPGAEPMKVGVAVSDLVTGLYTTVAILAAVIHQSRTGEGQAIDMALFDCQAAALANQATNYLAGGIVPGRLGNAHPNIVPYQVFATKDGHLILAVSNDNQFRRFAKVAGLEAWAKDPRFSTNAERVAHRQLVVDALRPVLAGRTSAQWIADLETANVPCGPINRVDQVFSDPQAIARGLTVAMQHATVGELHLPASPLRLSRTPPEYRTAPPLLGEHNEEVLNGLLGIGSAELQKLRKARVV